MKKTFLIVTTALLFSCGKSGPAKEAEEICDCFEKAMALPVTDANRMTDYNKCMDRQRAAGEKYMKDSKALMEFNEVMTPCLIEMLKGQH